jgi:hypothetical protein
MQLVLLEDVLSELTPEAPTRGITREMLRVAADAHALGTREQQEARYHRQIRDFTPLVHLEGGRTVLAFLLGPMTPDLIDAALGRLLRECARNEATTAVIDMFGAEADDDRFHRTIRALLEEPPGRKLTLVLTGLRDAETTRAALSNLGADVARVRFEVSLNEYLARSSSRA